MKRRQILTGAAAVGAAAVAYPAVRTAMWRSKDWTREGFSDALPDAPEGHTVWRNWGKNQISFPTDIASFETEEELADAVKKTTGRVRPAGSGHSFSGLLPTDGLMVRLDYFSGMLDYDEATGDATFGSGTLIFEAAEQLYEKGRSFENLPDINVQSLAGAFNTATHGTGNKLPAMHDCIKGFRMVTADGQIIDVDEQNNPDLLSAGKVGLGSLGIITQYTIKTVPAFRLKRTVIVMEMEETFERWDEFSNDYSHFEFFLLPGSTRAVVLLHEPTDIEADFRTRTVDKDDEAILQGLRMLRDNAGWSPFLRRKLIDSQIPLGVAETGIKYSHEILSTERIMQFVEMEYHLPKENSIEMVKKVANYMGSRKDFFYPIEVRQIGSDNAMISPFNGGERMSIATHRLASENYDHFFKDLEPMYLANGGRPHWGKLNSIDNAKAMEIYPTFGKFMEIRKQMDPTGKFLNHDLARLFGESI